MGSRGSSGTPEGRSPLPADAGPSECETHVLTGAAPASMCRSAEERGTSGSTGTSRPPRAPGASSHLGPRGPPRWTFVRTSISRPARCGRDLGAHRLLQEGRCWPLRAAASATVLGRLAWARHARAADLLLRPPEETGLARTPLSQEKARRKGSEPGSATCQLRGLRTVAPLLCRRRGMTAPKSSGRPQIQ